MEECVLIPARPISLETDLETVFATKGSSWINQVINVSLFVNQEQELLLPTP